MMGIQIVKPFACEDSRSKNKQESRKLCRERRKEI